MYSENEAVRHPTLSKLKRLYFVFYLHIIYVLRVTATIRYLGTDCADQHSLGDLSSLEMEFMPMLNPDAATKRLLFRDGNFLFSLASIDWEFGSPTVRA